MLDFWACVLGSGREAHLVPEGPLLGLPRAINTHKIALKFNKIIFFLPYNLRSSIDKIYLIGSLKYLTSSSLSRDEGSHQLR